MQNNTIKIILFFLLFIAYSSDAKTNNTYFTSVPFKLQVNEELKYNVKWGLIKLGSFSISCLDSIFQDGKLLYEVEIKINSNPSLPFISLNGTYFSLISKDLLIHHFYADQTMNGQESYTEYTFNYQDSLMQILIETPGVDTVKKSLEIEGSMMDMAALIYYARKNVGENKDARLTTFYDGNPTKLKINFYQQHKKQQVRVDGKKINAYYLDGKFEDIGIFGLQGDFQGWFSPNSSIPIKAKMRVFIGNITLEKAM